MKDKLFVYSLIDGKKKVYIGLENIDTDLLSIYDKHRGKRFTRVEKNCRAVSKETALRKLNEALKRYYYGHKGTYPRYNTREDDIYE